MPRKRRGNKRAHLIFGDLGAVLEYYARHRLFTVTLVWYADDLYVLDLRMGVDELLDLLGVDILSSALFFSTSPIELFVRYGTDSSLNASTAYFDISS